MNEFIVIQTLQVFPIGYSSRYYYHCTAKCGFRHRADAVNTQFEEQIKKFTPHPGIVDLYRQVVNIWLKLANSY